MNPNEFASTLASDYIDNLETTIATYPNPINRARQIHAEIAAAADVLRTLGRMRRRELDAARVTMTAQEIADSLGISRARVYELLNADV